MIRKLVIAIGMIGVLLFGAGFMISILKPDFVESIGKDLIRYQIEKKVKEKINHLDAGFLSQNAERFIKGYDNEIEQAKRRLESGLPEKIANVIAEMRNLDCECRKKIEKDIRDGYFWQIASASQAQEKLTALIRTKYMETASQLTREFRIFTVSNVIVFLFLAVAGLIKKQAGMHLVPTAAVMLGAAGITSYFYLFKQDWLYTLVFSDYLGWGYVAYLVLVFALLSDVIFNRGRVISSAMNGVAGSWSPC